MTSPRRLFTGSCLSVAVIGLTFAIRGDTIDELSRRFALTHAQMGWIASAAFWGFVLSMIVAGQLCDWLGMGRLLRAASIFHVAGVLLTIFASGFWTLWSGTLCIGMGNALVEAAVNPLIATVYSSEKTQKLNAVHAWFPWGDRRATRQAPPSPWEPRSDPRDRSHGLLAGGIACSGGASPGGGSPMRPSDHGGVDTD